MTLGKCEEVEQLIDQEAQGWNEAERLRVEQHLYDCEACLETLSVARVVRETMQTAPYALSEAARGRAIERALSSKSASHRASVPSRRVLWGIAGGGVLAAAAALVVVLQRPEPLPVAQLPSAPAAAPVQTSPSAQPATAQATSAPDAQGFIEAASLEQHTFAHASVQLAPGTRLRFDETETTIVLERGQVDVDVEVSEGRPFRVSTSHFRVEVLGTRFSVTPETVRVERGHVQVYGLDGEVLARDLSAGASFSYKRPIASSAPQPRVSAHTWLARAREALTRGNTSSASELIDRAERSDPRRPDRAEASTLRAEVALLERDPKAALRLYLSVSTRYAELPSGENAAFAAAQLAARGEPTRERELLQRYLQRYPRGRFADESRQRLSKLGAR